MKKMGVLVMVVLALGLSACGDVGISDKEPVLVDDVSPTNIPPEVEIEKEKEEIFADERLDRLKTMQDELEELLLEFANFPGDVGISYLCLTTGRHISVNGDQVFHAQSTVKLAAHMMVVEAVNDGMLAWNQNITITEGDMPGAAHGSMLYGIGFGAGHVMSLYELMRYSITHSDNLGFNTVMRRVVPYADPFGMEFTYAFYQRFFPDLTPEGRHRMSPNQQTELLRHLFEGYGTVDGFDIIVRYMMNTPHKYRFVTDITRGYVANIPGWFYPDFHDSGIFFTEFPYILVVYSSGNFGSSLLSQVSEAVFKLHNAL